MKTINLYFDFEFTSLSPDAQPISLGIVSDKVHTNAATCFVSDTLTDARNFAKEMGFKPYSDDNCCVASNPKHLKSWCFSEIYLRGNISDEMKKAVIEAKKTQFVKTIPSKSFYAEFSDFDINRCDDWVKENVIKKLLRLNDKLIVHNDENTQYTLGTEETIIKYLKGWLSQFSDYKIQFVCDCGTFDWYWMIQLLAEWEETPAILVIAEDEIKDKYTIEELQKAWRETPTLILNEFHTAKRIPDYSYKTGLPKLPANISPVSFDLNDLIAIKDYITPREAFDLNREELALSWYINEDNPELNNPNKHNALWDAKIIKEIYNKLR